MTTENKAWNNKWSYFILGIILILSFIGGCTYGDKYYHKNTIVDIKYVPGPIITDTIIKTIPTVQYVPSKEIVTIYKDTIWLDSIKYVVQDIDSFKVLQDWLTRRDYNMIIFDIDTIGKCELTASIYKNTLDSLSYVFTPITKVVQLKKEKIYTPFMGIGFNTQNDAVIQLGIYRNKWGVSYQLYKNFNDNNISHGLNLLYRF